MQFESSFLIKLYIFNQSDGNSLTATSQTLLRCMLYNWQQSSIINMTKFTSLLFLSGFFSLASKSQTYPQAEKECRITSGIGFAGATKNTQLVGQYVWLQLDYKVSKNISVATEFENMTYKLKSFEVGLPKDLDGNRIVGSNFSLLLKYYIETKLPLKLAFGSGWTYTIKTSEYYYYERSNALQSLRRYVSTDDDYEIPLLLEMRYPIWKTIDVHARVKYNLSTGNQSTYSSGVGLSLKL